MSYLLIVAGLATLAVAGDLLIRGAVDLALRIGIPPLVIGLTVVAFGTSAPELVVSVDAALTGSPGIALGNVVGSNVANVLLVLGLPAIIAATAIRERYVTRNTVLMAAATVVFTGFCLTGVLTRWEGIVLFAALLGFVGFSLRQALRASRQRRREIDNGERPEDPHAPAWRALALILVGLAGLPLGAHLTIESARSIALSWGISEAAVGVTVVALGTSLPELATTTMAALRRQAGIAVGNVIGSNLFNILAVIGITAIVVPVPVPPEMLRIDVWAMLACALLVLGYVLVRRPIGQTSGLIFVALYVVYITVVMSGQTGAGGT